MFCQHAQFVSSVSQDLHSIKKSISDDMIELLTPKIRRKTYKQQTSLDERGKSKWSWKEREDDMRELERKNLEQKREIQKLKKFQETAKGELEATKEELEIARKELEEAQSELGGVQEKLDAETTNGIEEIVKQGEYSDPEG